ncbi:MAG: hypothetical protein WDZ38_07470 [Balneolaceae bacterium]
MNTKYTEQSATFLYYGSLIERSEVIPTNCSFFEHEVQIPTPIGVWGFVIKMKKWVFHGIRCVLAVFLASFRGGIFDVYGYINELNYFKNQ